MLKKGTVTIYQGDPSETPHAHVAGVHHLRIETQEDLDRLHRLVAEGKQLPLKPAPGSRQRGPEDQAATVISPSPIRRRSLMSDTLASPTVFAGGL